MTDAVTPILTPSAFDTERFGLVIHRARADSIDARLLATELIARHVDVAVLRLPAGRSSVVQDLARWAMPVVHADTLVYYRCDLTTHAPPPLRNADLEFSKATEDDMAELRPLIAQTFSGYTSHYHANRLLPATKILAGYQEWAERHASDSGKTLWLARRKGRLAAFAACESNAPGEAEGVLYGVAPGESGGGLYGDLIRHTQSMARAAGSRAMKVSTQVNNFAVQKVWAREGFHLYEAWDTFHVNALLSAGPMLLERELVFTNAQIRAFAEVSGDDNPIHVDPDAASQAGFPGTIAHGVMALAEISRILGTELPGAGTLISHFDIAFIRPIVADRRYRLRITSPGNGLGRARALVAQVTDEAGALCVLGRPTIVLPRQ